MQLKRDNKEKFPPKLYLVVSAIPGSCTNVFAGSCKSVSLKLQAIALDAKLTTADNCIFRSTRVLV